jgi:hypothetical protein
MQAQDSSGQSWILLAAVWGLDSTFRDLDQPILMESAGMQIDHLNLVHSFDRTACHYEVQQAQSVHHHRDHVRSCYKDPRCAVSDRLVCRLSDPSRRHVFSATEVWTKPYLESLLYLVEAIPGD